jgi:trigger factor
MELIQNKEGLVATLTVKVSQEDYAAKVERELKKIRQTSQIKGFRPGNAPMSLIKKMYGTSLIIEEINKLILELIKNYEQENVGHIFAQVIPSENNQVLTNIGEQKDFEFVYEAGFFPEFTYTIDENTELPYYNILVDELEIDSEIEGYRNMYDTVENIETIENDCIIIANVNLVKDGEEITHSTSFLINFVADEHKQLFFDAKVNDTVEVEIHKVFTNEIDLMGMLEVNKDELALLPETLPFTITKIVKRTPAQINQDLFDKVAGKDNIHSEEELREYAKAAIIADYNAMSLDKFFKDAVEILLEKVDIDMPNTFIEKYIHFLQKEEDEISEKNFEEAVSYFARESKWKYIMSSLLTQDNIQITYDMLKEELKVILRENYPRYNDHYSDDELNRMLNIYGQNDEYMHYIIGRVKSKQLAYLLKEKAKLNIKDVTVEEFHKLYDKNGDNILPDTDNTIIQENNNEEIQS